MSASERTKLLLAQGLKEMSVNVPFRKIRVGELCDLCGVDRRTFYYHFRDIYDLAAWIFDRTIDAYLPLRAGRPTQKGLERVLNRFREEEVFYRRALAEDSQNALGRHYLSATVGMYSALVQREQGRETLTDEESFAVGYHCFGSLGMIRRWLYNEPERSAAEFAAFLIQVMPPVIRRLYEPEARKEEQT